MSNGNSFLLSFSCCVQQKENNKLEDSVNNMHNIYFKENMKRLGEADGG
jgi:hypothetical protein